MSKKRTLTVQLDDMKVNTGWSDSEIRFQEYRSGCIGPQKECVVKLRSPSDVSYIRDRLDEVEAYWRKQIETYSGRAKACVEK
jgi:hypothetical protein